MTVVFSKRPMNRPTSLLAMKNLPQWADHDLSVEMPVLRAAGESQDLEYMTRFPTNTRELAKEIAAFASTNAGTILIGVSDEGDLVGIEDAANPQGRDGLVRRIEGLCNGPIRPSLTPKVSFAVEEGMVVLAIRVTRGNQPVYYCQHVPYVRHLTEARPASPSEVVDRVKEWVALRDEDPVNDFYDHLIPVLGDSILWGDEADERLEGQWWDSLRWGYESRAANFRTLAATSMAIELGLHSDLERLADLSESVSSHRFTLGPHSAHEFAEKIAATSEVARQLKDEVIDQIDRGPGVRDDALERLRQAHRKLEGMAGRADRMIEEGRLSDLQTEASTIGRNLLRLGYWGLDREAQHTLESLRAVGRRLHLLETVRIIMGANVPDRIMNAVRESAEALGEVIGQLDETGASR